MKKILIIIAMMLASCHSSFTVDCPFVVKDIVYKGDGKCMYYPFKGDPLWWYCNHANVGDTIWLTTNPYK